MTRRAPDQSYPIRAVARLTGLSVDTLRAWERRYEAVVPQRGDRGRVYSGNDVARLKQLAALVDRGHAIGTVAGLSTPELTRLLDTADSLSERPPEQPAVDLTPVFRALDRYDLGNLEAALARYGAVLPPVNLVFAVVLPLLRALGDRWEAGRLSPAQEHLVSAVVRTVLGNLLRTIARPHALPKMVFATLTGEHHELGLLCAAILAASAGYGVVYLGADLPAAEIARAATITGATSVVISATTEGTATHNGLRLLGKTLPGVDLWIGGPQAEKLVREAHAHRIDSLHDLVSRLGRGAGQPSTGAV